MTPFKVEPGTADANPGNARTNPPVPIAGEDYAGSPLIRIPKVNSSGTMFHDMTSINGVTPLMGNGATGTGSQRVTVASDNTPFPVKTDQTTHGTTDKVAADLYVGGSATAAGNGTTGSSSPRVTIASDNTPFPIKTDQTTHGTTDKVAADLYVAGTLAGIHNAAPVTSPGTFVSGVTAAMTGTTSTQVIAAVGSNYIYVTSCSFSNTHASVTTMMSLQDGNGGTTLWTLIVPYGGGNNVTFPTPLKVTTIGNALYVVNVTTGSNTFASCNGYASTSSR
jgi:hypothetical protein